MSLCVRAQCFFKGAEFAGFSQECLKGSKLSQALCLRTLLKNVAVDVVPSKGLFWEKGEKGEVDVD